MPPILAAALLVPLVLSTAFLTIHSVPREQLRAPGSHLPSPFTSTHIARTFVAAEPVVYNPAPSFSTADVVEVYRNKQPSTPPDYLQSDRFANYTYQENVGLSSLLSSPGRRTIIVGDIHGSLAGFETFLNQVGFDPSKDSIVLVGDLVAKGPQSLEVIDKARAISARCVRGNHDDKVIRWKGYLDSLSQSQITALDMDSTRRIKMEDDENADGDVVSEPQVKPLMQLGSIPTDLVENSEHYKIARSMSQEQYQYLVSCPLILTFPRELSVRNIPVHVVHAGIDPQAPLGDQQPWVLLNVRNILKDGTPSRKKKKGYGWAHTFNEQQPDRMAAGQDDFLLVYGHDASRSLNVKPWSVGLDSGCVYGRALSGYVVETGQILTVPCPSLDIDSKED